MGKVLKAVAIIAVAVAVAYFAPQISAALVSAGLSTATAAAITTTLVSTAIAAGVSAGLSLLAGKPSTAGATPSVFRQTVANSFIIYGKRRVGGLLIFFHPRGKDFRYFVIAVAGHRCQGVVRWWLGDEQVTVDGSGKVLSGKYAGNAWLWFMRGTEDQAAHPTFVAETDGKWTAAHRGRGTALIYAKFKMTDDVVQAGMPNITAEVEGKDDILDPRTGARGYTRNAALVFYDWLALPREIGGFGAYDDEIDWDWVAAQAGASDELVDTPIGQERRYEFDAYLQTGAAPSEVRDTFVTCCAGAFALYENDLDARISSAHPGRHYVGYATVPTAGSPPSTGGGGSPPGGYCVVEGTPLLMAPDVEKPAGVDLLGERVYTRHEVTLAWGMFPVEAVEVVDSDDVWRATVGGRELDATGDHLVYVGAWMKLRELPGAVQLPGTHRVVKMTVTGAHTYVSNGVLSHNIKMNENEQLQ